MDVVVAARSEDPRAFYNHIAWCRRIVLNLFIYVGIGHGKSHSSNPNATKHVFDWPKHHHHLRPTIVEIPNSSTGTEASAYVLHIVTHYSNLPDRIAFLHAHPQSWHSPLVCPRLLKGIHSNFEMITHNAKWHCVSHVGQRNEFNGLVTGDFVRNRLLRRWTNFTGLPTPERINFQCCAQFISSSTYVRTRSLETWVHILRSITQSNIGNYFEYMWAALLDPGNADRVIC